MKKGAKKQTKLKDKQKKSKKEETAVTEENSPIINSLGSSESIIFTQPMIMHSADSFEIVKSMIDQVKLQVDKAIHYRELMSCIPHYMTSTVTELSSKVISTAIARKDSDNICIYNENACDEEDEPVPSHQDLMVPGFCKVKKVPLKVDSAIFKKRGSM